MNSPFYNSKKNLIIYEDRIVLPKMNNRVIYFSDIHYILFRKIDFALYRNNGRNYFTIIHLKTREDIELTMPLSGYYALKNYYEKGIKSNGLREIAAFTILTVVMLVLFFAMIYMFVLTV